MLKTIFISALVLPILGLLAIKFTPLRFVYSYFLIPHKKLQGEIQLLTYKDVRYFLYLPPGYHEDEEKKYPMIYHLHGAMPFSWKIAQGIIRKDINLTAGMNERLVAEKRVAPSIIVAPYDGLGTSMWSDSWSGHHRIESQLMEELIPHLQSTYSITEKREETTLQGFSMGGFGATKLGFKYPHLFGKIISWDGALHSWETIRDRRKKIAAEIFKTEEAFDKNSPWKFSEQYAASAQDFPIKVFVVEAWVKAYNQDFKAYLERLDIPFEYVETGCPHDLNCMMEVEGMERVYGE